MNLQINISNMNIYMINNTFIKKLCIRDSSEDSL